MRLTLAAATVAAAAALTLGGAGTALAATPAIAPAAPTSSSVIQGTVVTPGTLTLDGASAAPGSTITFSGALPTQGGSTFPTLQSVTSPAFAGPGRLDRTNPDAFDGSATIAAGTRPGVYEVYATGSQGGVSARLTVTGSTPTPTPNHGGTGTGGSTGHGTPTHHAAGGTGSEHAEQTDATPTAVDLASSESSGSTLPLVIGGIAVAAVAGGGAYALGRGRAADRSRESRSDDPRTERMDTNWR